MKKAFKDSVNNSSDDDVVGGGGGGCRGEYYSSIAIPVRASTAVCWKQSEKGPGSL